MKIIKPVPITDANLVFFGLHGDTEYPEWESGVTYPLGAIRQVNSPSSTVTIAIASPVVITWASHGFPVNTPIIFSTTGALPSGITAGVAYFVYSVLADSFQICAEIGGAPIITYGIQSGTHTATASTHKVYESLQAGNLGKIPRLASSSAWWLEIAETNHWKMFDGSVTSQTVDDAINVQIRISSPIDSLVLFNISGASLNVVVTDDIDGEVYNQAHSLIQTSGIGDWWSWFFTPVKRIKTYAITDLPPITAGTIAFYLTETAAELSCRIGAAVIGLSEEAGGTEYGASVSITNYSIIAEDDFGVRRITQRAFSANGNFVVVVDHDDVERFYDLLAENRAVPAVYIGSDLYRATIAYGIPGNWGMAIDHPTESILTFEVKGLT